MTEEELAKIKAHLNSVVDVPPDAKSAIRVWHDTAFAFAQDTADLLDEVEQLRAIVRVIAATPPFCVEVAKLASGNAHLRYVTTVYSDMDIVAKARAVIDIGPLEIEQSPK